MSVTNSTLQPVSRGVIYALARSSTPDHFRYVGKTIQLPERRMRQHLLKNRKRTAKDQWLFRVAQDGETVRMTIIEECPAIDLDAREIHWIAMMKAGGHQLLNGTLGGDGGAKTDETRAKLSAALKGRKQTDDFRAKVSKANKGKTLPPEHREKIASALRGRKRSPETIEKMRKAAIGNDSKRRYLEGLSKRL